MLISLYTAAFENLYELETAGHVFDWRAVYTWSTPGLQLQPERHVHCFDSRGPVGPICSITTMTDNSLQ